jgi:YARHG domain
MNNKALFIFPVLFLLSCSIKDEKAVLENEIDSTKVISDSPTNKINRFEKKLNKEDLIGFWVGNFYDSDKVEEKRVEKSIYADEGLNWNRTNKINISIDSVFQENVIGHSVVAGNNRPFRGTIKERNTEFLIEVSEPGDDKYDGEFSFKIQKNDSIASGTWKSFGKIEIQNREFKLLKTIFKYDSNHLLRGKYGDWSKLKLSKEVDEESMEFKKTFAASSELIYEMNASNTFLTKKDVENLKKGDLLILRNTIYARHGYSFKNRPLRVFFDSQEWYFPVHTDIKRELTEIEKRNIKLLLKYEKNAKQYYDYFGRG